MKIKSFYLLAVLLVLVGCEGQNGEDKVPIIQPDTPEQTTQIVDTLPTYLPFDRARIEERLADKIEGGQALVVHTIIPLCDNEHQGIVRVPKTLGDGRSPSTNLYWGARFGFRAFFQRRDEWERVFLDGPVDSLILERVVFRREYPGGPTVYLVGDAYAGHEMKGCLERFLGAAAGRDNEKITLNDGSTLEIAGRADLLVFNGHNGLMDVIREPVDNVDGREREAMVIACASQSYFQRSFLHAKAYPLLMTTNLMAPEMYVLSAAVDAWAAQQSPLVIVDSAASGYHQYQGCGRRAAKRLFATGWSEELL